MGKKKLKKKIMAKERESIIPVEHLASFNPMTFQPGETIP